MDISAFDYELPEELIAQEPLPQRDASRMLVVDRERQIWSDAYFADFAALEAGDVLSSITRACFRRELWPARVFRRSSGVLLSRNSHFSGKR